MVNKKRLVITIPPYLKGKLERIAEEYGCSQAAVIRTALIRLRKEKK